MPEKTGIEFREKGEQSDPRGKRGMEGNWMHFYKSLSSPSGVFRPRTPIRGVPHLPEMDPR